MPRQRLSAARQVAPGRGEVSEGVAAPTGRQTLILEDFPSTADAMALSPNGRVHWATKNGARTQVAVAVKCAVRKQGLRRVDVPVRLLFRYVFPDRRKRDIDNLTTGVTKAAIDALVRGEVLPADDSEHVTEVKAEAVVHRGRRCLVIEIQEV